jgi:hypothetical protein
MTVELVFGTVMFAEWLMSGLDTQALLDHQNQPSPDCFPIMFPQTHGQNCVMI